MSTTTTLHQKDNNALKNRLKRIEGQLRGIMNMLEDDRKCEDILVQISSAKAALHKTGQVILEGHIQTCFFENIKNGADEQEEVKKLAAVIEQFSRIV